MEGENGDAEQEAGRDGNGGFGVLGGLGPAGGQELGNVSDGKKLRDLVARMFVLANI